MSEPSFTCPVCGAVSHNPNDIREGYCGRCHDWTGADHKLDSSGIDLGQYDRQGHPISVGRWAWLSSLQRGYRRVGYTVLGELVVSTVWLGDDMSFGGDPPLIFETMMFTKDTFAAVGGLQWRYATEEQAQLGHALVCALVEANDCRPPDLGDWEWGDDAAYWRATDPED